MPDAIKRLFLSMADARQLDEPVAGGCRAFGLGGHVKSVDAERRTVRALASTAAVDRYGEVIEPEAFRAKLDRFMSNPVLLPNHTHASPDGGSLALGQWSDMAITAEGLEGTATFTPGKRIADEWLADFKAGSARAFSVGFIPHKWEARNFTREDGTTAKRRVFTDVELLEISAVTIPANHEALVLNALTELREAPPRFTDADITRIAKALADIVGPGLCAYLTDPLGPVMSLLSVAVAQDGRRGPPGTPGNSDDIDAPGSPRENSLTAEETASLERSLAALSRVAPSRP